jgi:CRP/FNR family transcriptional regulator, cyclic AMP receptor protein
MPSTGELRYPRHKDHVLLFIDGLRMLDRFAGEDGLRRLVEALSRQMIVEGNRGLAERLARQDRLRGLAAGDLLISEGKSDNDLHLIVAGRLAVLVKGREVAIRGTGTHVGEMATIDPSEKRCASVVAMDESVVLSVSEPEFSALADEFPRLWRMLALELGSRLRQRNELVARPNPRPVMFLGSASESLTIVRAIENGLAHDDVLLRPWCSDVFHPSEFPIDDLIAIARLADFAALIVSADDRVTSRKKRSNAPRDNVVFELGLAMGQLDRDRTVLVQDANTTIKIPSDLLGLTPLKYRIGPEGDVVAALGPVVNELRSLIGRKGCR